MLASKLIDGNTLGTGSINKTNSCLDIF